MISPAIVPLTNRRNYWHLRPGCWKKSPHSLYPPEKKNKSLMVTPRTLRTNEPDYWKLNWAKKKGSVFQLSSALLASYHPYVSSNPPMRSYAFRQQIQQTGADFQKLTRYEEPIAIIGFKIYTHIPLAEMAAKALQLSCILPYLLKSKPSRTKQNPPKIRKELVRK